MSRSRDPLHNADVLSQGEFEYVINSVTSSFDLETVRYEDDIRWRHIVNIAAGYYQSKDLYSYFIPVSLENMVNEIFTDVVFREFILNWSERIAMLLCASDIKITSLVNSVVNAVCLNKINAKSETASLVPAHINESVYVNGDVLADLLKQNIWLLNLYILTVFFQRTETYKTLKQEQQ